MGKQAHAAGRRSERPIVESLTSYETISCFADQISATLTVMKGGEHWFHTDNQMAFLDQWIKKYI